MEGLHSKLHLVFLHSGTWGPRQTCRGTQRHRFKQKEPAEEPKQLIGSAKGQLLTDHCSKVRVPVGTGKKERER